MITTPPQWTAHVTLDGLALVPPGGVAHGTIRYRERVRPLAAVRALVAAAAPPGDWVEERCGPIERLVTAEGEHAALVVTEGRRDGRPAERVFGFVLADDYYASIVAEALAPEAFATFRHWARQLTLHDAHVLGTRRRRYVYTPPAGFQPLAGPFDTTWYPLDYPRRAVSITVAPALPQRVGLGASLLAMVADARPGASVTPPRPARGRGGLSGELRGIDRPGGGATWLGILEDASYVYPTRLDLGAHAGREELDHFEALIATIDPIPGVPPRGEARELSTAIGHWAL